MKWQLERFSVCLNLMKRSTLYCVNMNLKVCILYLLDASTIKYTHHIFKINFHILLRQDVENVRVILPSPTFTSTIKRVPSLTQFNYVDDKLT